MKAQTNTKTNFKRLAKLIGKLRTGASSQRDYLAHKVMLRLLMADTLEEYQEIRDNTPKDVKDRVFELANTTYPEVFLRLNYLTHLSRANRHPNKVYFLGDCLKL